ncbi:MAG TPA: family 43 glycosylhydrolase, partial [Verrucomicrobiae bacterium]|nr:family 43 glycosylhydrolase [Verrucomicrobiae bacterium]
HGSIVTDPQGRDYLLYHAYHAKTFVYVGRQGLLDEITWNEDGWPSINNNKGPSTNAAITISASALSFADEFSATKLRPEWQWPQNNHPNVKVSEGFAVLRPAGTNAADVVASIMAVKTTTANYTATTAIDAKALNAESKAGLSAYGDRENALGVTSDGTTITLWRRQRNKTETVATVPSPKTPRLHFQMVAKDGHRFQFAVSGDGKEWKSVGNDVNVEGQHLPPWDRGIRVALTSGGSENATARFDFLKVDAAGK